MTSARPRITCRALRMRWSDEARGRAIALLQEASGQIEGVERVLVDGREYADLRGLSVSEPIRRVTLRHVELSCSETVEFGMMDYVAAEECRFVAAKWGTSIGSSFVECTFELARLRGTILRGSFRGCSFESADLSRARGSQVRFVECSFRRADLELADFDHCDFDSCNLDGTSFRRASVSGCRFTATDASKADFTDAVLDFVKWS